ncbi:MAG TPA: TrmH family RNA methyltransferase [Acidimicrobiia bacterium]
MVSRAEIRKVASLHQRSQREATGLFLIEGLTELERATGAGVEIETVYALEDLTLSAPVVKVSEHIFDRIAYGRDGIVAVAHRPGWSLADLTMPRPALVLVAEGLEKPGNLGAILRTADATGAAVIVADDRTDLTNPNVVRASLGTLFTVPIAVANSRDAIGYLREGGVAIVVTEVEGGEPPWRLDLRQPVAVVIGSESQGVSTAWREAADSRLTLPMTGTADSLNASVTAGVILFEAVRQRILPRPEAAGGGSVP